MITTFTADGIIDKRGHPWIIEFNRGIGSGAFGYKKSYGHSIHPKIVKNLKSAAGYDKIWFDNQAEHTPYDFSGERLRPSAQYGLGAKLQAYVLGGKHLVFPERTIRVRGSFEQSSDLHVFCSLSGPPLKPSKNIEIADAHDGLIQFYKDKRYLAILRDSGVISAQHFPKQKFYQASEKAKPRELFDRIMTDFQDDGAFVIKHPRLYAGKGVSVITHGDIDAFEKSLLTVHYHTAQGRQASQDLGIIVQKYIEPQSLSLDQAFRQAAQTIPGNHGHVSPHEPMHHCFRLYASYVHGAIVPHGSWLKFATTPNDKTTQAEHAAPISTTNQARLADELSGPLSEMFEHILAQENLDQNLEDIAGVRLNHLQFTAP